MSAHHLGKGSTLPPFNGKLRIYSMRFCPYAQRTHLVLNAKKLPYEVVNINLTEKPEWLTTKSPLGKVPALEIEENVIIYESLVTAEYLDDKYPLPRLTSSDPLRKAQDKLIVENFSQAVTTYYKVLLFREKVDDAAVTKFLNDLEAVQKELVKRSTKFLAGKNPGMVDYMIWPWFERFSLIEKMADSRFAIDKSRFQVLNAWIEDMKKDPAVRAHYLDPETHGRFYEARHKGEDDYDFLL